MNKSLLCLAAMALALLSAGAAGVGSRALAQPLQHVPPVVTLPVVPPTPQFNNPGPQIQIPPPGNPLQQLSPIESTRPRVVSPGVGGGPIAVPPIVSTSRKSLRRHASSVAGRHVPGAAPRKHAGRDRSGPPAW